MESEGGNQVGVKLDPVLSLAMSVHANKGIYALLLGSGVSRSAGIPTGWEIVLDLVRKVVALQGEDCGPDPEYWYTTKFDKRPEYSELLGAVARTSAERRELLRSYFEPSDEDREEGRKQPTNAHKAIAKLVRREYIRVILTTNFDRLLEIALEDEGISPTVIASADAAEGAMPLAHSRCTVIKLHGDYLDTRLKNTPEELATYDPRIDKLLDRVLDEYGLIVCGWSAEWDTALRSAIERCPNRRFTTYWCKRGTLTDAAK